MDELRVLQLSEESRQATERQILLESAFLTNIDVVNGWQLPLRNGKPALPTGLGFGWHQDHIDHIMTYSWNELPTSLTLGEEDVVLLSFAGG